MTKFLTQMVLACVVLLTAASAFADFEILGSYNYAAVSPGDLNTLNKADLSASFPTYNNISGFGADVRYVLPVSGLLIGGRYEMWSAKGSASGTDQTVTANRGAVLVGYRFINMATYLGLIGSYGISNSLKVATSGNSDLTPASAQSYSAGLEGGLKLSHLIVGVELGYLSMVGTDLQAGGSSVTLPAGGKSNLDLSGAYGKIQLGFSL